MKRTARNKPRQFAKLYHWMNQLKLPRILIPKHAITASVLWGQRARTNKDAKGYSNTVQLIQVHLTCITKEKQCPNEIPYLKHCNRFQMYAPCRIGRESWFSYYLNDYDALSLFQVDVKSWIGPQPLTQNELRAAQRMSDEPEHAQQEFIRQS